MFKVCNYDFESEEMAKAAEGEAEAIRYLREQTRMDDPDVVLKLYNKLLDEEYFATQIGISFLVELQEYLHTIPYIKNEDVRPIPITKTAIIREPAKRKRGDKSYKAQYRLTLFLSIVFGIIIVGMFGITYFSGNNVNMFNYEQSLIERYEGWEAELDAREAELDAREAEITNGTN